MLNSGGAYRGAEALRTRARRAAQQRAARRLHAQRDEALGVREGQLDHLLRLRLNIGGDKAGLTI